MSWHKSLTVSFSLPSVMVQQLIKSMYVVQQLRKILVLTNALKQWRIYLLFSHVVHPSHAPETMKDLEISEL